MHDLRHDPDVTIHTQAVPEKGYTVTWTEGPVTFVPASPPSHTVYDVPAKYGIPTSTDRLDALEERILQLERHAEGVSKWEFESVKRRLERAEAQIHVMSEQMALMAGDVPFAGRMAEDAWGVG